MNRFKLAVLLAATAALLTACGGTDEKSAEQGTAAQAGGVLNLYSARHYDADQLLYDSFTRATGIEIRKVEASPDLIIERMKAEGDASPADVVLMADAGALWRAEEAGLLQPLDSEILSARIPRQLREEDGRWFGLAQRARVIAYDKDKVRPEEVATYEQLASPRFRGKLCVRSSDNVYNQSFLAAMIERMGPQKAEEWARGIVANMAREPQGGDRDQIKGVAAGACEVALTNSYYYVRLVKPGEDADPQVQQKVALSFPGQAGNGTHVNISGGGIAAHAPNRDNAEKFLEYLATDEAQTILAGANNEFPAVAAVQIDPMPGIPATYKTDPMPVTVYGARQAEAQAIFDRVGWR